LDLSFERRTGAARKEEFEDRAESEEDYGGDDEDVEEMMRRRRTFRIRVLSVTGKIPLTRYRSRIYD
jgi:hypothetical protein